ncbi:hypothetical protein, partial [Mesorhizobium sp. M0152]|uniref:hypothetical protein n=1 Tax=Mesorhizobium sp. M0152 TaxID=2956898 RepID=UPI003338022C
MEIEEAREVRTTCPYCGVGCGVLAKVAPAAGRKRPRGPPPPTPLRPGGAPGRAREGPHQPRRRVWGG